MNKKKFFSVQDWLPYKNILKNGIIKLKDDSYIKIIKVIPINFNLKSDLEKESILNSYKIFLKTCNFDIQILIQSNKEDISKSINKIKIENQKEKNLKIKLISEQYIEFLQNINKEKFLSSKIFYILIKNSKKNKNLKNEQYEENIIQELNEKYFKIKENLSRCGNNVLDFSSDKEIEKILFSFLNTRLYFNQI